MNTYKTDLLDLRCMDCMELMRDLPDNSVDSIVTDPPYGLSKEPDMAEVLRHWLAGDDYVHKGSGFMGKSWDSFVPGPTIWKEAFRVLKPGGHLLAFAGSRTQDLMGIAIRLAGFENRDCLMWVFGSGFPKSANVSKMIDKQAGAEREVVGKKTSPYTPTGRNESADYGEYNQPVNAKGYLEYDITAPATEAAKQWDGWGSALKPAYEPCLMFRKPLAKGNTIAANVLEYGTGAINVDGSRVGTESGLQRPERRGKGQTGGWANYEQPPGNYGTPDGQGRWPANLIHDGSQEVLDLFPETGASNIRRSEDHDAPASTFALGRSGVTARGHNDNGGSAARFFYQAKCSKKDRNEGLPEGTTSTHPTVKPTDLMRYLCRLVTPPSGTVLDPFMGSGSTGKAAILEGFRFIGSDMSEEYFEIAKSRTLAAVERIQCETQQTTLF